MNMIATKIFYCACFILLHSRSAKGSTTDEWDYDHHHTKPEDWKGVCKLGRAQSPIDINTHQTLKVKIKKPISFHNYFERTKSTLRNNGHTLVMEFDRSHRYGQDGTKSNTKWIEYGGLPGSKFELKQAHFHWGSTGDQGSEHTINNQYSPMEMHFVHWNRDIAESYEEAVQYEKYNSLAVLAINFKLGEKNQKLDEFFDSIKDVQIQNQITNMKNGVILEHFLPDNTDKFFRYNGSLTTPGCNQIVVWTIFKEQIEISQDQMDAFRRTTYVHSGERSARVISNNYRPTQPLNGRNILDIKVKSLKPKRINDDNTKFGHNDNEEYEKTIMVNEKSSNRAYITSDISKAIVYLLSLFGMTYHLYLC